MEHLLMSLKERTRMGVMQQIKAKVLSLVAAAKLLRLSYRQSKRVWRRYRDKGDKGLVHRGRGRDSAPRGLLQIDPAVEKTQVESLARLRERRDSARVASALESLREAVRGTQNSMPLILEAVRSYATVGEICQAFRDVFGEWRETPSL